MTQETIQQPQGHRASDRGACLSQPTPPSVTIDRVTTGLACILRHMVKYNSS
jgi:hypothetical protein